MGFFFKFSFSLCLITRTRTKHRNYELHQTEVGEVLLYEIFPGTRKFITPVLSMELITFNLNHHANRD